MSVCIYMGMSSEGTQGMRQWRLPMYSDLVVVIWVEWKLTIQDLDDVITMLNDVTWCLQWNCPHSICCHTWDAISKLHTLTVREQQSTIPCQTPSMQYYCIWNKCHILTMYNVCVVCYIRDNWNVHIVCLHIYQWILYNVMTECCKYCTLNSGTASLTEEPLHFLMLWRWTTALKH